MVTNLAFLSGFAGGVSSMDLIRFAGIAAVLAGSVSMFFGGLLAERSEHDLFQADSRREAYEVRYERHEELAELKDLYTKKGLSEEEAELVVNKIASDEGKFLEDILANELHIHESQLRNPFAAGGVLGSSFFLGAVVPLIPYYLLTAKVDSLIWSVAISLVFLFAAGAWRGRLVQRAAWKSGLETLAVGAIASGLLYVIGSALTFV